MEHAQRDGGKVVSLASFIKCLNPYFNGTCSKSLNSIHFNVMEFVS